MSFENPVSAIRRFARKINNYREARELKGKPVHESRFVITEQHIDSQGHFNHGAQIGMMELAARDFLDSKGLGLGELNSLDVYPMARAAKIEWLNHGVVGGDNVTVSTVLLSVGNRSTRLHQWIDKQVDGEQVKISKWTVTHVAGDRNGNPIRIPDAMRRQLGF